MSTSLSLARVIADAVLYEGYLLYPYRASSQKNQSRWQFGILGPPGASAAGVGEESSMFADCLLQAGPAAGIEVRIRFLALQTRTAEKANDDDGFTEVPELRIGALRWLSWDEATEHEVALGPFNTAELMAGCSIPVQIPASREIEPLIDASGNVAGRLVRSRRALQGTVTLQAAEVRGSFAGTGRLLRVRVTAENTAAGVASDKQVAIATSFIGTHLLLSVEDSDFLSLLDPPEAAREAAASCSQHRCWPVLAGPEGQTDVLLLSPIILYDHPAVAPESSVALFDATEIDEILTLRILTLTEEEKSEARATDPRAGAIIDKCEAMSADELAQLHGALRNPHALDDTAGTAAVPTAGGPPMGADVFPGLSGLSSTEAPWWDPAEDASVRPETDAVMIDGIPVARGSRVTITPRRRADAQDLFSAGQIARVTGVHFDVDGSTHVAVVIEADPAAELQEWYGRYLYFAPDELEPLVPEPRNNR
ncbi:hypothetical protein IV498_09955 [Paenarthrobacter sp. Z7-10]|uniref:hypothetical protein n=1 Tax=Paenarthrobacter sp. Z7-10 TaxID=2787635 RepID=UPI0022A9D517|nr:hypothetical protein [Paenarthrobacter sp. Z7-10]MCZ2403496.1 hypothetical protein [Paenarthrobacter sp. Z7-10]